MLQAGTLSQHIQKQIPRSTRYKLLKKDLSILAGAEYSDLSGNELIKLAGEQEQKIKTLRISAYTRLKCAGNRCLQLILKKSKEGKLKAKKICVRAIEKTAPVLGLARSLRELKMHRTKFYSWRKQINALCLTSPVRKCMKVWSNQLTANEMEVLKRLVTDPLFTGWSFCSRVMYAWRQKWAFFSLHSAYKYRPLLGLEMNIIRNRRKNHLVGLRGLWPLDIVNVDVTVFFTSNNQKIYIYLIMDNYSRYILGWKVTLGKLDSATAQQNLKEVYEKYFKGNEHLKPTRWIIDGGPENVSLKIKAQLENYNKDVIALIAQKDIKESNSMVESLNKRLKYQHLFLNDIPDFQNTVKQLEIFVEKNNNVIPQRVQGGYTPHELLTENTNFVIRSKAQVKEAYNARIETNRQHRCQICPA